MDDIFAAIVEDDNLDCEKNSNHDNLNSNENLKLLNDSVFEELDLSNLEKQFEKVDKSCSVLPQPSISKVKTSTPLKSSKSLLSKLQSRYDI